ncbi:glycine cleavage system aminomethyltransferase T/glycine/D-amino acid oxidase-like deaminating enzyme [Lipingzhangella halophila]|uniref:Glycine cleavage system aminomethyltransferase T/glycine/D-amino acid oxidase-like deaminating enzyme n=1 Tax=Lipingzhangella halophila TaxID=1783352 RepID=A0A7W7RIN8_9ACTN|nr:FAD-dependent oxidoreductase [Lipingzhangella halophila]MBB4932721.1 glycine cleavage system aminomethyltransferase T/glycine/D-amino acid oxidase-like deaminating enzyme [Lipingzhangella halophila]
MPAPDPAPRTTPRVVVIGAGIVGCALADELTVRGYTDVTVVDQGDVYTTGGSTSHAPGLVFQTSGSKTMVDFASYTARKYEALHQGGQPCFNPVGGLELAVAPERLDELHRRCGWARSYGIEARVLSPEECAELHPLVEADRILGGLYTPSDGLANAVGASAAQGEAAVWRGARFLPRHEVTDIEVSGGRVTGVITDQGHIPADLVVCSAGMWGPRIAGMVGMTLPLTPLEHQFGWTGRVPALAGAVGDDGAERHPMLRYQERDLYYRGSGERIGIGYYGHRPIPVDPAAIGTPSTASDRPMPSMMPFTPEDFAPAWSDTLSLLPELGETKLEEGFNGLFSFTPDNMPLIGESPDVAGFWVAEAVWITHSAGVARATAELIVDGHSTFDLHACEVNRFQPHQLAPSYLLERDCQNFVEVYDAIHPQQPMEEPRPLRTSPFYPRQTELSAFQLEASGWERPHWYEANADLVTGRDIPTPGPWARRYWSPIIGAEAQVTRERVALYDMSSLMRLEVTGPGSAAFLDRVTTARAERAPGAVSYCLILDERGHLRGDITVARVSEDHFQLGVNSQLDLDWLRRRLPADGTVQVRDITPQTTCIGVWGPLARDLVQPLADYDLSNDGLRYFRCARFHIAEVPVLAMRVSYVGELGWELYTTPDVGLRLWDTLWKAGEPLGVIAAGRGAFNSLRLEKGYRAFGADMTDEHDPYEAGVDFALRMNKGDYTGRSAVEGRDPQSVRRKLTCLTFEDPSDTVMGNEPVYLPGSDSAIGYVTSAAWGYTIGTGIAYAWVPASASTAGTPLEIGYFDRRVPATTATDPLFDPEMKRLRV